MTRVVLFCVALAGCSSSGSEPPRSELQVTLGTNAPATLATEITTSTMGGRFFMNATDGHVTVIVSLATPVTARQVDVASDTEVASIWGQMDAMTPLLTRAGTLAIESTGKNVFDFTFTNVSKPKDAMGMAVLITGSITGVPIP